MGRPSKYPAEFREQAVQLVRTSGRSQSDVAEQLGISTTTLGNWVRASRTARGEQPEDEQMTENERAELRRLRKENSQLRMEREILKRAAAFFVTESTR